MLTVALAAALACPGPPGLVVEAKGDVWRTTVVACDGTSRVVVRRARLVRRRGTEIGDVAGAGRRVAWSELRRAGRRRTGSLHVIRVAGGRIVPLHRRPVIRPDGEIEVKLTRSGELAWLTGGRVYATARLRGHARLIARDASYGLRLEDGRTLRWFTNDYLTFGYADLRPWPGGGCPRRSRFRRVAESPQLVLSAAFWDDPDVFESVEVIRACVRATGADPVVAQGYGTSASNEDLTVAAIRDPWVVLVRDTSSRYDRCTPTFVEIVDPVGGRAGRGATLSCDHGPQPDRPPVVTDGGTPAWIVRSPERSSLLTTSRELDAAGPDGLTGLVADGPAVRWLHDGEPRSAVLD